MTTEMESQTKANPQEEPLSSPSAAASTSSLPHLGGTYHSLVVDSGPLIRLAGSTELWRRARSYYTVPAVLAEIRDAKAREHLSRLPFELRVREPTPEGVRAVTDFARQTGDYHSLSSVDLQVLGLLHDLEREANHGCLAHVRTAPKRVVGLGPIRTLGGKTSDQQGAHSASTRAATVPAPAPASINDEDDASASSDEGATTSSDEDSSCEDFEDGDEEDDDGSSVASHDQAKHTSATAGQEPASWARVVADRAPRSASVPETGQAFVPDQAVHSLFGSMRLGAACVVTEGRSHDDDDRVGQFSDAEEDDEEKEGGKSGGYDFSSGAGEVGDWIEEELKLDFPSLAAASTVPFDDGGNNEGKHKASLIEVEDPSERLRRQLQAEEERKQQSLRPVSHSGKLYNSFRRYGDLMKPKPKVQVTVSRPKPEGSTPGTLPPTQQDEGAPDLNKGQSRIMGGMTLAGQEDDVEDDGEGWITTTAEIRSRKAGGSLDPTKSGAVLANAKAMQGPPIHERSACATTDFAMQNVILQMNLELLSVDGVKVRKLKSFVTRCGACYKIYTSNERSGPLGKRLFCDKCGSDMLQRIAASVDSKTGRLRLHLSKRYKHNLRGTKFSLPKPGTGDRFKGDLLLREDQLLMGAWNQKVKMSSGGKARASAQSMFGKDLASNVGCNARAVDDDIRVGFGRRNPNAVKGRERRGKRKKTSEKACGLRRY